MILRTLPRTRNLKCCKFCVKSDSRSKHLWEMCKTQVLKVRNQCHNKIKLQTIFRKNHRLLLLHVILLCSTCQLSCRVNSAYEKLLKSKKISMRMIKRICILLKKQDLIDPNWLMKHIET